MDVLNCFFIILILACCRKLAVMQTKVYHHRYVGNYPQSIFLMSTIQHLRKFCFRRGMANQKQALGILSLILMIPKTMSGEELQLHPLSKHICYKGNLVLFKMLQ